MSLTRQDQDQRLCARKNGYRYSIVNILSGATGRHFDGTITTRRNIHGLNVVKTMLFFAPSNRVPDEQVI